MQKLKSIQGKLLKQTPHSSSQQNMENTTAIDTIPVATPVVTGNGNKKNAPVESDVYDRQIRLWGAEAQTKIQNSKVLYLHVTGSSAEVLKNLCLAGISATICDPRPASVLYTSPCFFTPPYSQVDNGQCGGTADDDSNNEHPTKKLKYDSVGHAVRPLVEELNPLLGSCPIVSKDISTLTSDDVKEFSIVIASQVPLDETVRISKLVPKNCVFYTIDCFGMRGVSMIDFGRNDFQFRPEQGKKLLDPTPIKDYVSLSDMVQVPLANCTNRFHKTVPVTWAMYRALLEYQRQTKHWMGDNDNQCQDETNAGKKIIQEFLKNQHVTTILDTELDELVMAGMAQVSPVCAVLGGMVGNEVIKVISGKGEPANNTLLLDGGSCKAWTFMVKAKQ